ncbi:MAG: ABC transporter permease [Vicinamibacterales bacterium]
MRDWHAFVRARLHLPDLAPEREARIVREVAAQLEDLYRDAVARGASGVDADARAAAHVTDWPRLAADLARADRPHLRPRVDRLVAAVEERPAERRSLLMFAHLLRDTRYAVRQLIKAPAFTIVAVATLALGIGATTAIFSVVNGVLLQPLPYPQSDRLVRVNEIVPQYGLFSVAPANFFDWRAQNHVFERIVAFTPTDATLLRTEGPELVHGMLASWDLFQMLDAAPALGSSFTADEDKPGGNNVVVINDAMWRQEFGTDRTIIGRAINLNGTPVTVIGVMPPGFYFPTRNVEFWRPIAINPVNATRGAHYLGVLARMKPGVTVPGADADMKGIAERLAREYPDQNAGASTSVVLMQDQIVGAIRPALLTLFAAVGLVVLIACANVANLLLVRAAVREKEIAIRAALGANRRRLFAQVVSESLVLAIAGGAIGIGIAYLGLPLILKLSAGSIPRAADVTIDRHVLLFAAAASIATGLLFSLAPAWQSTRAGIGAVLKEGGRSSTGVGSRWIRSGLLVVEVALSIVLLTGAALLLRSFDRLTTVAPGFDPDRVLAFRVSLPQKQYTDDQHVIAFYDALIGTLEAQPGVRSAGLVQTLPMQGDYVLSFNIRGHAPLLPSQSPSASYRAVSPDYFAVLGVPLLKGRAFAQSDRTANQPVAVVDQAFADQYFPNQDPIGQGLHIGNGNKSFFDVVGVVGNVHYYGLDATSAPTMYVPIAQDTFSGPIWVVERTNGDPASLAAPARQAVRDVDPLMPTYSMTPLAQIVSDSVAPQRFSVLLLATFAGIALFLAAVGLYGVVSYSVQQRTREIGLRMALGAAPRDVLTMIVGGAMKLALAGVILGLAGAAVFSRLAATLLFEVTPSDPVSYAATSAVLFAIAILACYAPARRAMRVDPIAALQAE